MGLPDEIYLRVHFVDGERKVIDLGSSLNDLESYHRKQVLEFFSYAPEVVAIHSANEARTYKLQRPLRGHVYLTNEVSDLDLNYVVQQEGEAER